MLKILNDQQSYILCKFSQIEIIQLNQTIIMSIKKQSSEMYWEYRTAGHLVFSTPWPAV